MNNATARSIAAGAELLQERIQNGHATEREVPRGSGRFDESVLTECRTYTDVDDLERYLAFEEWPADEELPEWIGDFSDLVEYLSRVDARDSIPADFQDETPFEGILYWIVEYGMRTFVGDVETDHLSPSARRDFEKHLLDRLLEMCGLPLHMDYVSYIAERDPTVIEERRRSPDSTEWHDGYVSDFLDDRSKSFFQQFPVLARLITVVCRQWGTMVTDFASRLEDDYRSIRSLLDADDPGRVASIDAGAGDPHGRGKTVLIVEFESGDEIVYKPRNVDAEVAFYEFETWLADQFEDFPRLQTPDVIDRPDYAWVEKVESNTFDSLDSVRDYYRRAGALMCVLYVTHTSDCHVDNVVACETSPVIIDAETVLQPDASFVERSNTKLNKKLQGRAVRTNIFKTVMLPYAREGYTNNRSGLAMEDERPLRVRRITWKHVNTDAIDFEFRRPSVVPEDNIPEYNGDAASPLYFVDEITSGFEDAYDAILQANEENRKIADRFTGMRSRYLLQPTAVYQALLDTTTNPEFLRSGAKHEYKIELELSKQWSESTFVSEQEWRDHVMGPEIEAVFRRDVPRFTTATGCDELYFDGKRIISGVFDSTGVEEVRKRIDRMSERDKARQLGLIRACLRPEENGNIGGNQ